MSKTLRIASIVLILIVWALCLWLIPINEPQHVPTHHESPAYHGADAVLIGWHGEVTALEWTGTHYRVMWRRGRV